MNGTSTVNIENEKKAKEYSAANLELLAYYNKLVEYKNLIKSEALEFSKTTEKHASFYGDICNDFNKKNNETYEKMNQLIASLENQCNVIKDNAERAASIATQFKNLI